MGRGGPDFMQFGREYLTYLEHMESPLPLAKKAGSMRLVSRNSKKSVQRAGLFLFRQVGRILFSGWMRTSFAEGVRCSLIKSYHADPSLNKTLHEATYDHISRQG